MHQGIPHRVCAKLKSNSGASLILVLVLFFLCVMISSVIVAAAASGASRNANREKQQQGYLSIVSAVRLAREEMLNCGKFVGREETADYGCNASGSRWYTPVYYDETMDVAATPVHADITEGSGMDIWGVDGSTALTGVFRKLLMEACEEIYDERQSSFSSDFTITSDDARLADVYCNFFMDSDFNIAMKFTAADTNYAMTLRFTANQVESSEAVEFECVHSFSYMEERMDGSMVLNSDVSRNLEGGKNIRRTTITWNLPTVSKGVD